MTERTDLSSVIELWLLDDEPDAVPERVLTSVATELRRIPQRSGSFGLAMSWRTMAVAASAVVIGAASLVAFGITRPGPTPPPVSPMATSSPYGSRSPTPTPSPARFSSTEFGFSAVSPLREVGPWNNFLYAPIANGTALTFPDGKLLGGDLYSSFIIVSSGTRRAGAVIGTSFPPLARGETPPPNPDWAKASLVRIWSGNVDQLAQDYIDAEGGEINGGTELDGERAILITSPAMATVVVAVHGDRAFVIGTTSFMAPTREAPSWERFLASFRFLD